MPSVKKGIYGGQLSKKNVSLEHLKAHSKGGESSLRNFALATKENNNARGNEPLPKFLTWDMANKYLDQFKGIMIDGFNGNKYIEMIRGTLEKLIGKCKGRRAAKMTQDYMENKVL